MKTQVFEDELYYVCHDGRELHHLRTETKEQAGYTQRLRCMDVPIVVAVNIKQNVSINMILKKIERKIKS